jgi:ATP-dependent DNA ligase
MDSQSTIKKYKNSVTRKYISISKDEIDIIEKGEWYVSKKFDGQLWFYVKEGKNSKIVNANENEITSKIKDILKDLDKNFKSSKDIILAGELYYLKNDRERYGDTISGLGDKTKLKNIRYGVFDVVYSDKAFLNFVDKYNFLKKNLGTSSKKLSHAIDQDKISQKEISKFFSQKIEKNDFEGLIVRNESKIYKIKLEETADLLITGFTIGSKPNQVRSVSLGIFLNKEEIVHVGSCGSFASEAIRKDLFKILNKSKVSSNFQKIASNGSAYMFVKPEIVVEVKLLEMQGDKSNDEPIRHLKFKFDNKTLNATGKSRSVSILNSRVIEIRKDKKANENDCGLNQITRISGIPKEEFKDLSLKDLPKSKIIKKVTYVKDGKKGKAIKKFIFWKSNKEKTGDYPSYLCYYLDFSDGRKDPIKKKIYPFEDEKEGLKLFKFLLDENVKKGWEQYGT